VSRFREQTRGISPPEHHEELASTFSLESVVGTHQVDSGPCADDGKNDYMRDILEEEGLAEGAAL
jgi:hypothetical protein